MTTPTPNAPEVFGKYVLLERLAAGGMGEVFLARAGQKGYEKFFALKRILAQHAESPEFAQMLMNEARISVALVHPNIAQVFEFGELAGNFFMVLEYVEGLSLNAVIRRGRDARALMKQSDAVWVALQVCRALHYAHNKRDNDGNDLKIVHRDISPHNILIDETGSVKLIDFGIAKAAQGQIQTEASTIKGKIPYMSPEQASGQAIDRRSDLYALGIVLYECLTFERMYPAGNTFETFALVRHGKIPDLDEKLGGKVPASLLALVKKALQQKPDDRYQTAAEMESDLSRILHELEPGHTSYGLADLVAKLDAERDIRKDRLKSYAKIVPDELLQSSAPHFIAPAKNASNPKLLAPPLPVDVTLGSLGMKTPTSVVTASSRPKIETIEAIEDDILDVRPKKSRAPLVAAVSAAVAVAALVLVGLVMVTRTPGATVSPNDAGSVGTARGSSRGASEVTPPSPTPATTTPAPPPPATPPPPVATTSPPPSTQASASAAKSTSARQTKATTTSHAQAKPSASATACVAVNVVPWAYVSEHGKRLGQTPLPCLEMTVGHHTLDLENPALGKSKSVDVVVKPGDGARVVERFN